MKTRVLALLAAAVLVVGMIAGPGIAWYSDTDTDTADTKTTDSGDESTDLNTTGDDEDEVTEPDTVESHNDKANANSQSVITLSGCTVNSSKDISSVTLLDDGSQLDKDDSVDSRSYDLNSFGEIDEVDAIRVKAGTTIATFSVNCGSDDDTTTDGDDEATDDHDDEATDDHDDEATDDHDDDADHQGDDTEDETTEDDATEDDGDDTTSDDDTDDDDSIDDHDDDDTDDDTETDAEWDARHDGRHERKDHEEIQ